MSITSACSITRPARSSANTRASLAGATRSIPPIGPAHAADHAGPAGPGRAGRRRHRHLCEAIHRRDGEPGVRRILGVLALVRKHGAVVVTEAGAALEFGVADYRFVRRYLERHPAGPLTLRQVDLLIRELTHYRDVIARKTQEVPMP